MKSKFIVIEGPDRVGKATQVKLLQEKLAKANKTVTTVEVPLRSNIIYHLIYWMLGNGLAKKFPKIFQWFQYFNRQIFQWMILPRLDDEYDYIIMDRWSLSTVVYGAATGVPEEFTQKLYKRLKTPDHTIILLGKSHQHVAEDVYESDNSLQEKVRKLYAIWSEKNQDCSSAIECSQPREVVFSQIINALSNAKLM